MSEIKPDLGRYLIKAKELLISKGFKASEVDSLIILHHDQMSAYSNHWLAGLQAKRGISNDMVNEYLKSFSFRGE